MLSAIEDDVLAPKIMEASIARAVQMLTATQGQDDGASRARAIATLDRELERLTMLAASGGSDIPSVLEALRTRQERRRILTAEALRSSSQRPPVRSAREIEATLRSRFSDFRGLLRRNVIEARPVLESLLAGRQRQLLS